MSNGDILSQGVSNCTGSGIRKLYEPGLFRQTLGIFGSIITNK